jgi:predicted enzyme related to lactoylglutathione lyase
MGKVVGLGGVFVKIEDQDAWRAWYRDVLGVSFESWGGATFPHADGGQSVLSSFPADTTHFAPSTAAFMINLIVDDMNGLLKAAEARGVKPLHREEDAHGRFATLIDPAGIKVELWEPAT